MTSGRRVVSVPSEEGCPAPCWCLSVGGKLWVRCGSGSLGSGTTKPDGGPDTPARCERPRASGCAVQVQVVLREEAQRQAARSLMAWGRWPQPSPGVAATAFLGSRPPSAGRCQRVKGSADRGFPGRGRLPSCHMALSARAALLSCCVPGLVSCAPAFLSLRPHMCVSFPASCWGRTGCGGVVAPPLCPDAVHRCVVTLFGCVALGGLSRHQF